jgi:DNA-binding IclR family transcriptional regulator
VPTEKTDLNKRVAEEGELAGSTKRAGVTRRAFDIFFSFSSSEPRLTSVQIAHRTGVPLPTVYRQVAVLREMGLLLADPDGRLYLSPKFIALGHVAEAADAVIDYASPCMTELGTRTHETVLLVRLIANAAVCVHRIDSPHRLRISFQPGQPLPLEHGASAKVLLSSLPPVELAARLERVATTDPEHARRLADEVARAAAQGWATSEEEIDEGFWAISAAVRAGGQIVAALTIPVPLMRATPEIREEIGRAVRETAADIGTLLDGGKTSGLAHSIDVAPPVLVRPGELDRS